LNQISPEDYKNGIINAFKQMFPDAEFIIEENDIEANSFIITIEYSYDEYTPKIQQPSTQITSPQ
jgi:hypothetical protein